MKEALFYSKGSNQAVHCSLCFHQCTIQPGKTGICGVRENREGILYTLVYGKSISEAVDPIEKKPVFHYHPGSRVLSLGGVGCSLRCTFCQNWRYSYIDGAAGELPQPNLLPHQAIELALDQRCQGIAWTYNEPTISFDYVRDCAMLAQEAGLFAVLVTNGYISLPALDLLAPHLDVYRVDLKSLSPQFYHDLCHGAALDDVLRATDRAKAHGLHLEVSTPLVPGWNDTQHALQQIARWIATHLGPETPWHLLPFQPAAHMSACPSTGLEQVEMAIEVGRSSGLYYAYSAIDSGWSDTCQTLCPLCGQEVVLRDAAFHVEVKSVTGHCPNCGLKVFSVRGD